MRMMSDEVLPGKVEVLSYGVLIDVMVLVSWVPNGHATDGESLTDCPDGDVVDYVNYFVVDVVVVIVVDVAMIVVDVVVAVYVDGAEIVTDLHDDDDVDFDDGDDDGGYGDDEKDILIDYRGATALCGYQFWRPDQESGDPKSCSLVWYQCGHPCPVGSPCVSPGWLPLAFPLAANWKYHNY